LRTGVQSPPPTPYVMRVFCIVRNASRWIPRIEVRGASGRSFIFVSSPLFGHVWDRGELGLEDSAMLEDVLGSRDSQHRPVVTFIKADEESDGTKIAEANRQAMQAEARPRGRPRKVLV
jgi:hypothetical protein